MLKKIQLGSVSGLVAWIFNLLTFKARLHKPVHVGPFAGSLLKRSDWDHP